MGDTLPPAHAYPALQFPVQEARVSPGVEPYLPGSQGLQAPAPPVEYVPGVHTTAVGLTDPTGHAYPGLHGPLHTATVTPLMLPNRPASQPPEQAAVVAAGEEP